MNVNTSKYFLVAMLALPLASCGKAEAPTAPVVAPVLPAVPAVTSESEGASSAPAVTASEVPQANPAEAK